MVFIIVKINKKITKLLEILYNIVYDNHTKTIAVLRERRVQIWFP